MFIFVLGVIITINENINCFYFYCSFWKSKYGELGQKKADSKSKPAVFHYESLLNLKCSWRKFGSYCCSTTPLE